MKLPAHSRRKTHFGLCAVVSVLAFGSAEAQEAIRFVEVHREAGILYRNVSGDPDKRYIVSSLGSGAALLDFDQDGDLDLYLVNGSLLQGTQIRAAAPNRLYRNDGAWKFTDVTQKAGVGHSGWGMGCAVGDFDNDGLDDLLVTNLGKDALYRNRGDGSFEEVTQGAGLDHEGWSTSAAFFDADGDGDLDLYIAHYALADVSRLPLPGSGPTCRWFGVDVFCGPGGLAGASDLFYRNLGNGHFEEATREAGLFDPSRAYGLGVVAGDYDGDGDTDLYVANDSVPNFLLQNDGQGRFEEAGLFAGVAYNADGRAQAGMGVDMGDLDGDGALDLFVTNFSHDTNTAYRNAGRGLFSDTTTSMNLRMTSWFYLGWATHFVDLDNDGDQDLFVANGHVYPEADQANIDTLYEQRNQIFWNQGAGAFQEGRFAAEDAMEKDIFSSRGGAFGDLDDDGDVDVVVVNIDAPPSLLRNDAANENHWLSVLLVGRTSNRNAVGARVTVVAGGKRQMKEVHASGSFLSSSDLRLHFGLGRRSVIDELAIRWPGQKEQRLKNIPVGSVLTLIEPP